MSLSTCYLEYGRHVVRLHRRRRHRAYTPRSNIASHDNHEKINSWVSFCFPYMGCSWGSTMTEGWFLSFSTSTFILNLNHNFNLKDCLSAASHFPLTWFPQRWQLAFRKDICSSMRIHTRKIKISVIVKILVAIGRGFNLLKTSFIHGRPGLGTIWQNTNYFL